MHYTIVSKYRRFCFKRYKMIELSTRPKFWFRNVTELSFRIFLPYSQSDNGILTFYGKFDQTFWQRFHYSLSVVILIVEKNDILENPCDITAAVYIFQASSSKFKYNIKMSPVGSLLSQMESYGNFWSQPRNKWSLQLRPFQNKATTSPALRIYRLVQRSMKRLRKLRGSADI